MAGSIPTLPQDFWLNFTPGKKDIEFISTYLFEKELPLREDELVPILVGERIRVESEALLKQQSSAGRVYSPKEKYQKGEKLVFPAMNWKKGEVTSVRNGINPLVKPFEVIEVLLEDQTTHQFASTLDDHVMDNPEISSANDNLMNPELVMASHGEEISRKLAATLARDDSLVKVADQWFPRALLMDMSEGHLNLAEAILDEAAGKPLTTKMLIEQIDLQVKENHQLMEFSLNHALQQDGRFDEVGPSGEVLWCLKRLEPEDVQQIPVPLRYGEIPHDRSLLTEQMLSLQAELNDELSGNPSGDDTKTEIVLSLIFPHWRAGTLPISSNMLGLFPTAYESQRVRFTLVDGHTKDEYPAWVVRQHGYVVGVGSIYKKYGLMPGSLVQLEKSKKPGQVIITPRIRRPTRDWVRTVLAGSDGGIVFAMLKQSITSDFNERMLIWVPDGQGVDDACSQISKQKPVFSEQVTEMMRELVKLNVQGHVHAQELYSAMNIVRRCPPGPLLAFLAGSPDFKHVGDLHYRIENKEVGDE